MAYSEQVRRQAADTLEARGLQYTQKSAAQREAILAAVPALRALEADMAQLGVSASLAALGGEHASVPALRAQLDELRAREVSLLTQRGYAADALQPQYFCAACRDTGYTPDGAMCACYKKLLARFAMREVNRATPLRLCSFDSFSLDYYPRETDPAYKISARKNMEEILAVCRDFAGDFSGRSLLMFGDAGLGKTHLALSIASAALERGFDVVYCSAADVLRQIETEYFENGRQTTTLDGLKQCTLLIFDDLGAEYVNAYTRSTLYDLVNTRISAGRSSVFTTNFCDEKALMTRYGEKISSRLIGCCEQLLFFGDDIRIKKNNEQE